MISIKLILFFSNLLVLPLSSQSIVREQTSLNTKNNYDCVCQRYQKLAEREFRKAQLNYDSKIQSDSGKKTYRFLLSSKVAKRFVRWHPKKNYAVCSKGARFKTLRRIDSCFRF